MTHDEMIEAVAKAIGDTTDFDGDRMASRYADSELRDVARAAIRVIAPAVLNEAARSNMTGTRKLKMTDTPANLAALGIKPVAWMYEHDGMIHDESNPALVCAFRREHLSREPWTETPLYSATDLAPLIAKARRVEALEAALRDIADRPGEGVEYFPGHGDEVISECRHMELIARAALKENTDATSD